MELDALDKLLLATGAGCPGLTILWQEKTNQIGYLQFAGNRDGIKVAELAQRISSIPAMEASVVRPYCWEYRGEISLEAIALACVKTLEGQGVKATAKRMS